MQIAELQTAYGIINVGEDVLQYVWRTLDFERSALSLADRRSIEIEHPGVHNKNEGPDFLQARLKIEGEAVVGDVEIHFYPNQWEAHEHHTDPKYNDVRLHVVLYNSPPKSAITSQGQEIPTLELIGYFDKDVESYADDFARAQIVATTPEWTQRLSSTETQSQQLYGMAQMRWKQKVHFAKHALENQGSNAWHIRTMEALGYRRNRIPMIEIAQKYSLVAFHQSEVDCESCFNSIEAWKLRGLRPANHPLKRLKQYAAIHQNKDLYSEIADLLSPLLEINDSDFNTRRFRKAYQLTPLRKKLEAILNHHIGGSRLDTLVVDVWLPLLAAKRDVDHMDSWYHWFVGDMPDWVSLYHKSIDPEMKRIQCNGLAQALLQAAYLSADSVDEEKP